MAIGVAIIIAFGAVLERRTALRRSPMTDLGVFADPNQAVPIPSFFDFRGLDSNGNRTVLAPPPPSD